MKRPKQETVLATYRVRRGKEAAFRRLLARHWPTLRRMGLVTATPPVTYEGRDDAKGTFFLEIFTWRDAASVERAHVLPEVGQVWERMGALVESRGGRPQWEFPHARRIRIRHAGT
jgi:hypothetical protein